MSRSTFLKMAHDVIAGISPSTEQLVEMAGLAPGKVFRLLPGADEIREHFFGNTVHLCTICNGKSGRCSEDCAFCSQSAMARTDAPAYPLMEKKRLREGGLRAVDTPINRYSVVTSGKRLPRDEVMAVAGALSDLAGRNIETCVSLGCLGPEDFEILRDAGITRYHHNLETAPGFFRQVCTSHDYQERIRTIRSAKAAGLSVCAGGVFGIGETDEQVLELALELKDLQVDSVPLNFLVPIKGTSAADCHDLTPLRCLKIISLFRYVLPERDILICGGREHNFKDLQPLIFHAGASGIMTGDYLTTQGRTLQRDLEMIAQQGLVPRPKPDDTRN